MLEPKEDIHAIPESSKYSSSVLGWNEVKVTQLCPTLRPHGLYQARILEWVAFSFSRGSSQPRDWTQVASIAARFFTNWATREKQGWFESRC